MVERKWDSNRRFFLFRRPYIWLLLVAALPIGAFIATSLIGIKPPELAVEILASDIKPIKSGQNTTFTISARNYDVTNHLMECHLVYSSPQLLFYEERTGAALPQPVYNGQNYTTLHPTSRRLGGGEGLTLTIRVKGLDPGADSYTYRITVEVYSDGKLSDRKTLQLTIIR